LANPKITKQWFVYAARDLKAAKIMLGHGVQFKNEIAFHVQQCIEKALKGYLVFHDLRPPKTHKLEVLAELLKPIDSALVPLFRGIRRISKYAVVY
jgi:HEPN domain-containing protein